MAKSWVYARDVWKYLFIFTLYYSWMYCQQTAIISFSCYLWSQAVHHLHHPHSHLLSLRTSPRNSVPVVCSSIPVPAWSGTVIPLRDTPPIHWSGCSLPTQIREYVNTRCTLHPLIHSWWPSVPCGWCTCLEFLATQCSVYIVAGFLLSASKESDLFAASFRRWHTTPSQNLVSVQCPCNSFCDSVT